MEHARLAGRRALARLAVVALLASLALAGCSSGGTRDRNQRQTAIYLAVLRAALPPTSGSQQLPLVFVSPLADDRPPTLEVQAALIEKLSADARVKFVDEEREAIDSASDDRPVLDDGVLVAISKAPPTGDDFELVVERYRSADDGVALRFRVRQLADGWDAQQVDERPARLVLKS